VTAVSAEPMQARLRAPWIVAVCGQKGGVGKTTLALGLAATTSDISGRALVVDVDPQRSAEEIADAAGEALPFDFAADNTPASLARLRQARDYDTVFADCPGSLDSHDVLREVLTVADVAIIPMVPERAAITPTLRTAALAAAAGIPARVVVNMADPLRGAGPVEAAREMLDREGVPYFHSVVRRYVAHSQSQLEGVMITQYRGDKSWHNALDDMRRVHAELLHLLGGIDRRGEVR
jgi:chromosome partitioning protein